MRTDDPWYDALASGRCEPETAPLPACKNDRSRAGAPRRRGREPRGPRARVPEPPRPYEGAAAVHLAVHRSAAFGQVRGRYRRFALPATAALLLCYLGCLVTATAAPALMARPVAGVLTVALLAGLAQFALVFLLTWAYVRHARLRRDRLALELRWETQDMARTAGQREQAR